MQKEFKDAFNAIIIEMREMRKEISEIKNNMATKDQVATKEQVACVMEALNSTNKEISSANNRIDSVSKTLNLLSAKDNELETVAKNNAYNIALLQGKAQ